MMSWSDENPGVIKLHFLRQAGGDELLDEIDPHAAGKEDVHGLGLGGADLGELGRIVELPSWVYTSPATLPL